MNVRRLIMVMLVLVYVVQGVSATSGIIDADCPAYTNAVAVNNYVDVPSGVYYYTAFTEVYSLAEWGSTAVASSDDTTTLSSTSDGSFSDYVDPEYGSSEASGTITTSRFRVTCDQSMYNQFAPTYAYSSITYTDILPLTASGSSCLGVGVFDIYIDGVYNFTDSQDGNYSFFIVEGVDYQIKYTNNNESEWHNFTASSSYETWDPSCPGTYTVSGTLLGPDGEGTNNALINLNNYTAFTSSTPANSGYSSATGSYSFENTEYGSYYISACGYGPCYPYTYDWFYVTDSAVTVTNLTYPEKINIRFRVLDSNSTPLSGLYLHLQDAPSDYGGWMSTDADGYTSYNSMYPSAIYVEIVDEDMTTLATTTITGNAQYEYQLSTITLPAPDANNTAIPVIPPGSNNSTPPTQPPAGGGDIGGGTVTDPGDYACTNTLTASVQDADHVAIVGAVVKLYPYNSSISGSHSGTTDAAGEYTFPCTNATLSYNVEARATCYEHEISEDEGYSGTAYFHLNKTLTLACGFDDGSGGGGTGTNGTDSGDPDLIAEVTVSDDAMKAPILNYLFGGFLLVIFYMVATFYKKK